VFIVLIKHGPKSYMCGCCTNYQVFVVPLNMVNYISPMNRTNTCNRHGDDGLDEDMQQQALVHRAARLGQGCLSALGPGAGVQLGWRRLELQIYL
jgi:hypothetical protein